MKPGQAFLICENVTLGKGQMDGKEFVKFELRVIHVIDKAIWTGAPDQCPKGKDAQQLMNLPGQELQPLNVVTIIYKDGVLGNEQRLKGTTLKFLGMKDEDWDNAVARVAASKKITAEQAGEAMFAEVCDPAKQPLKWSVIEMKAGEVTTKKKEKIVGNSPLRRVYAEELRVMWEQNKLDPTVIAYLQQENRLATMLEREGKEKALRAGK